MWQPKCLIGSLCVWFATKVSIWQRRCWLTAKVSMWQPRCLVGSQSVYVTARLFSDTETISSSVCWNANDQPHFELHHVVPIEIDSEFLDKNCKNNHLVIEVWNFAKPTSNIIGVATIPLHQLHTAFSVSFEGSLTIKESQKQVHGRKVSNAHCGNFKIFYHSYLTWNQFWGF